MAFIEELERRYAAGEPLEGLVGFALEGLQSAGVMAEKTGTPAAELAALESDWAAFEQLTREAWVRYPEYEDAGAHGMRPDIRAIELFGTVGYLARAGMYTPAELAQQGAQDEWLIRETLRLRALLICLRRLVDGMDSGAVTPLSFAGLVTELAKKFGSARVTQPGRAPC